MKKIIKILMILWGIFCIVGILNNFQHYNFAAWIIIIIITLIPFLILNFVYKKIQSKNTEQNISNVVDIQTPTYIETEKGIHRVDGKAITNEEIPYLIKTTMEKAINREQQSKNPKFHRTFDEEELSFNFSEKYYEQIQKMEDTIYNSVSVIGNTGKRWSKQASKQDVIDKITLCDTAIKNFEKYKNFCYKKGKGGTIYFQDMWEYCHNTNNECFSYIDSILNTKAELEELLQIKN